MPRYRKLYVKVCESQDVQDMPDDFHRLLWVLLPLGLDSQGRGIDNPSWIKAKLMPLRLDVTIEMIAGAMQWYVDRGMVERYEVARRAYFWIPTFAKYQGDTSKEAESIYPAPPTEDATYSRPTPELVQCKSASYSDAYSESSSSSDPEGAPAARADDDDDDGFAAQFAEVVRDWEKLNPRRQISPLDAEMLQEMAQTYGCAAISQAIRAANKHGAISLAYIEQVLRNGNGHAPPSRASPTPRSSLAPPDIQTVWDGDLFLAQQAAQNGNDQSKPIRSASP